MVGDLKSRLGIKRRKSSKNATEDASLYRPHIRAASDNSSDQEGGDYRQVSSPVTTGYEPVPGTAADFTNEAGDLHLARRQQTAMSYYSASDIPYAPTPTPPNERRPAALNIPPISSNNLSPASAGLLRPGRSPPSSPYKGSPPSPLSPNRQTSSPTHHSTSNRSNPGEYEMTLRPQLHSPEPSAQSYTSRASFVTASDGGWASENDDGATVRHGPRESYYDNDGQTPRQ